MRVSEPKGLGTDQRLNTRQLFHLTGDRNLPLTYVDQKLNGIQSAFKRFPDGIILGQGSPCEQDPVQFSGFGLLTLDGAGG